jgi:hypothetical protein
MEQDVPVPVSTSPLILHLPSRLIFFLYNLYLEITSDHQEKVKKSLTNLKRRLQAHTINKY